MKNDKYNTKGMMDHGDLTGKLGKIVHCTVRNKRFLLVPARVPCIPDISDSSHTLHIFVQVLHVLATGRLVCRSNRILYRHPFRVSGSFLLN